MLFKRIKDWLVRITNFRQGDVIPVDGPSGTATIDKDSLLAITTQSAVSKIAVEFDPTKPNDAGGYAYYKDEIVSYGGATYRFKVNHSIGAWNVAEVETYTAGQTLKFLVTLDNPEYLYCVTDVSGSFLFGARVDGSFDWAKGIPAPVKNYITATLSEVYTAINNKVDAVDGKSLINSIFANGVSFVSNKEYAFAFVDSESRFLFGVKVDGSFDWAKGVPSGLGLNNFVEKVPGKSLIDSVVASSNSSLSCDEFYKVVCDSLGRLLEGIRPDGSFVHNTPHVFNGGISFNGKSSEDVETFLRNKNLIVGNWSDKKDLNIPEPKLAYMNFTNINSMPTTKTDDFKAVVEFWDMAGNYFKKRAIINAQGTSSLSYAKKNVAVDFVNDEWVGDDTFKLKIGEWVAQDSFHLKAFAADFFRGVAKVGYDFYDQIEKSRGVISDATWKMSLVDTASVTDGKGTAYGADGSLDKRLDFGARCHPLGFPVIVLLNGEFYGIFQFMMKKHRDNYHMDKSLATNIHLDGRLSTDTIFGGSVDWSEFEVRNPKSLVLMDGTKYDGDDPGELMGVDSPDYDPSNTKHVITAMVKNHIESFSDFVSGLADSASTLGVNSSEFKALFESVLNVDNLIDYVIFCELTGNYDGLAKNWQWTTWDGERWFVNAYDLDGIFGNWWTGRFLIGHTYTHGLLVTNAITKYIYSVDDYNARMRARYAELKALGIVDYRQVCRSLNDMVSTIGKDFFKLEYDKWPSLCNSSSVVDSHWELVTDAEGNPVFGNASTYSNTTSYVVGNECYYGENATMGFYKFVCVSNSTGNTPFASMAYADSIWRVCKWIEEQFTYVDGILTN